ncbi:MAG: leucine-rich repeat domain-containing protein, partial [Bacteroidales bacterium]
LGSLLSSTQKANTTKLTLTGQINEADFAVMKSQMPALTYLDLSKVICDGNKIPSKAFGDQSSSSVNKTITTIILPESITTIELYAFYNCSGLKGSLTIPDNVITIGANAFYGCTGFNSALTLPTSLTTIGIYAFYNCSGFTGALNIPNNVTTIGSSAFESCSGFNGSLTLPTNLTTIGGHAFKNCLGFTGALTIPNKVTSIGMYAFFGSKGFNSVLTLPTSLTSIGIYAFYGCTNVTKFQFLSATPVDYLEEMLPNGKPVTVPTEAAVTAYQTKWGTSRHAITAAE